jgi:cytochrome c oxidase subunit 4
MAQASAHAQGQQHPIKLYLVVWAWLFVLSACSYFVDYFQVQGLLRYSLITLFMLMKAGLIVAIFMHMAWERLSLVYAILVPMSAVLVFVAIMMLEADYTLLSRVVFFGSDVRATSRFSPGFRLSHRMGLVRVRRLYDPAIEMPSCVPKHRHHDGKPDEERNGSDKKRCRYDEAPERHGERVHRYCLDRGINGNGRADVPIEEKRERNHADAQDGHGEDEAEDVAQNNQSHALRRRENLIDEIRIRCGYRIAEN